MDDIVIRNERKEEYAEVENLVRESFWNVYRPGCLEHYIVNQLRNDPDFVPELDFVMIKDNEIIGQTVYMKSVIKADDGHDVNICTLGPICIKNEFKRNGYGKVLLDFSLEKAKEYGFKAVCLEGNIEFYGKSGFEQAGKYGIRYYGVPEDEDVSFFLCRELVPSCLDGITGEYFTPQGYYIDEEKADEFDKLFPPKQKLRLPGQLF